MSIKQWVSDVLGVTARKAEKAAQAELEQKMNSALDGIDDLTKYAKKKNMGSIPNLMLNIQHHHQRVK